MLAVADNRGVRTSFIVIEDDPDHQKIAEMILNAAGIDDIIFFGTGEEAIEYFSEEQPDPNDTNPVILIDLMLPKISGFEILQHLKENRRWQASKAVVLSCSTSPEDRERSAECGADAFLCKPLRPENVKELLASAGS